jgi:hypothetical protein
VVAAGATIALRYNFLLRAGPIGYLRIDNRSFCRCRRDVALRLDDSLSAGNRRQRVRILTDGSSMTA